MTIRIRLTLLFALLVGSILLLFSLSTYSLYAQFRQQEFVQRLRERAQTTVRLLDDVGKVPKADLPELTNEHISIYDEKGNALYQEGTLHDRPTLSPQFLQRITASPPYYIMRADQSETVGFIYKNSKGRTLYTFATATDSYGLTQLSNLRDILSIGWLMSLIIVGLAGYFFAYDALRPVSELIQQANTISATNIHKRLYVGRQRDELANLSHTFNALLSRLEEAFVSQRSFVSHASHELRTPLTVMMGQIEVTRLQPRSAAEYEATLDVLLEEVGNMIRLVNGLLDLAQVSADEVTVQQHPIRIDELLWQTQELLNAKTPTCQIDIDFDRLPDQEDELIVRGDETLLQTVFKNLLENGCKYSANHRCAVQISAEPGWVFINVSDQGFGIPAADLPHIFEPFYRSDSTMTIKGYGIGLALSKRIITLHGGQISVSSVEGKGTTFQVRLPAGHPPKPQQPL